MLLPLQSVECYTAYASADVIGRRISLMYQTVEVQRFAIDEMIAMVHELFVVAKPSGCFHCTKI